MTNMHVVMYVYMKIWELLNMKYILYAGTLGVVLFLQYKIQNACK